MRNLTMIVMIILEFVFFVYCLVSKSNRNIAGFVCAGCMLLTLVATVWVWFQPSYHLPDTTGSYQAESIELKMTDKNRTETYIQDGSNRSLTIVIWYPKEYDKGEHSCPLIAFSHGSFGVKESNTSLYRELASHGYVVCSINHTYQCMESMDSSYRKALMTSSDKTEEKRKELLSLTQQWMSVRTGDINFVINELQTRATDTNNGNDINDSIYKLIDVKKIGLIGHSLGGSAVLGVGRRRTDVKAVISLEAPFMCDMTGVTKEGFTWLEESYPCPLLNVYSDSSWNILSSAKQYERNYQILNDDCGTTYDMYVKGAGHMSLTDLCYSMPPLCLFFGQNMFINMKAYTEKLNHNYLQFFDSFVKGEGEYQILSFE